MEQIASFIKPELLVLVPALYFAGMAVKKSESVSDKYIPLLLGAGGMALAALWVLATSSIFTYQDALMAIFVAVVQGVLAAGCSVYVNQLLKQREKND